MAIKRFRDRAFRGEQRMPGTRVNPASRVDGPMGVHGAMSQPVVNVGQHGGLIDDYAQFNTTGGAVVGRSPMVQDLPGRRIDTSSRAAEMDARMSRTLEARRQAKLSAADPGLSTRGRVGAPGRGARPVSGGLEGRGVTPAAGSRTAPGPMLGPGRTEMINARRNAVRANVELSRAGRTGGFRSAGLSTPLSPPVRTPMGPTATGGGMPSGTSAPPPRSPRSSGGTMRRFGNMSSRNKLMIGAGALVLGAAAYSGRKGDGTSSGRSGMTRY